MYSSPDIQAFNGAFISSNTQQAGTATFQVQIATPGDYVIWCRVQSPDEFHNSFFVSADGGPQDVYYAAEDNWGDWQWTQVNGLGGSGGEPRTLDPRLFTLSQGSHTIVFRERDRYTKLDRVILTKDLNFVPTEGDVVTFSDVPPSNLFYEYVENLARNEITTGCGSGRYCPVSSVTRAQMAVMLLKSKYGSDYVPPPATGTVFSDVPASAFAARWIEQLADEGITTGCGGGRYCPDLAVTRAQMAVFLLRGQHGESYAPPAPTGIFLDLSLSDPFTPWIEQLSREGVTAGCGNGNYCPNRPNTRGQIAAFLVRNFQLP
jgi:hypothetical protein